MDGITVGVNPEDTVIYVEYDIDAVFDWLCEGELDVLIEFVFEELLESKGVFDTLWVLEEEADGDTEILGLKVTVELADTIIVPVRPGDTDGHDVWEELEFGVTDTSEEAVGVNPGDGVNKVVLDWIPEGEPNCEIEFKTEAEEDVLGDAVSDIFEAAVWETSGVWDNVINELAEFEGITDTDAEDETELEAEYEVKGVLELEIDPVWDWNDEAEPDGSKVGVSKEDHEGWTEADTSGDDDTSELPETWVDRDTSGDDDTSELPEGSTETDTNELWETDTLELSDA